MNRRTHVGVLLVAVLAATNAVAEPAGSPLASEAPRVDAGLFAGGHLLSSESELGNSFFDDQVPESGLLFGLRFSYLLVPAIAPGTALNPRLALEIESKLTLSSTAGNLDENRESSSARVLGWRAQLVLGLRGQSAFRPFVLVGAGGETIMTDSDFAEDLDTDAAAHWGLGASVAISESFGLRVDFRHLLTAGRTASVASNLEGHLGFYYSFGSGSSGAGTRGSVEVADDSTGSDAVETVPLEGGDEQGKPADGDNDGVPDVSDACPNKPETINQIDDDDGCPEVDPDNDGLFGEADKCPQETEDKDGYEDGDGCPEADNDSDGRPDTIDGCPLAAESLNGYDDDDGCPDEVPSQLQQTTGVVQGVRFRGRSARLSRRARARLDRVATILKGYPSVRLRISGHTDNRGKKARNKALSLKRAEAVKSHLVRRGIDAGRLEAVGVGGEKPIADNKKRKGRAQNQRIELELIQGQARIGDTESATKPDASAPKDPYAK